VPKSAHFFDNRQREILIGIEPGHERLICLIFADILIDLGRMLLVVIPRGKQVFGRQTDDVF
jgi:hypothetical protein